MTSSPRQPIWIKLLLAFLTVAGLMVAFAITAVSELKTANLRAKELFLDQQIRADDPRMSRVSRPVRGRLMPST